MDFILRRVCAGLQDVARGDIGECAGLQVVARGDIGESQSLPACPEDKRLDGERL